MTTRCVRYGGRHVHRRPKPGGQRTESPTSLIAWCTPNASAAPCASAPSSTSVAISIFPRRTGRCCALASAALSGQRPMPACRGRGSATDHARGPAAPTATGAAGRCRLCVRPRSVGVEQVGLWALEQLDLPALLTRLGVERRPAQRGHRRHRRASGRRSARRSAAVSGSCSASTSRPSARCSSTAPSDALVKHRDAIEAHLATARWGYSTCTDGDALRPDQHLLRRRGERPARNAGTRRQRLPAADRA